MTYIYPLPTAPVVDTKALNDAISALQTDETADDAALDALKKAVEAIVVPDVSGLAKTSDLSQYALKSDAGRGAGEITPVFDPIAAPQPIVAVAALTGATVVSGVVGSQMVNNSLVHSFARMSTPPAPNTWNGTLTISPVVGACKVRFGITSAILGTIEVSINGAIPLTASNTVSGWSGATPDIPAYVDGAYTWFEVEIAQSSTATSVAIKIPVGRGLLPCIYAADAITNLIPSEPTALRLIDSRTGKEMVYRPSELARKADIPTVPDLSGYALKSQSARVADTKWFDTNFDPRYVRPVSKSKITSLTLEYKFTDGTIQQFSLTDFTTGFTNSGFWNGASDPNGLTRFVAGANTVVVSWDGTGENLTIAVPKGAAYLQIRKVKVNGEFIDWLPVYDPSSLNDQSIANAAKIATLESETHGLWLSKQTILDWVTDEIETGRSWTNGDLTYQRIFTGTTPNSTADSSVLSIVGAKEIVWWHGQAKQATGRRPAMEGIYSGNAAHGPMYWWNEVKTNNVVTGMELRQFNQTGDSRYGGAAYFVTVEYAK